MILAAIFLMFALRVFYSAAEIIFERDWPRHTWRGLAISATLLGLCISTFA